MKRPTSEKRARAPRKLDYGRASIKDWETLSRSGRYDMRQLKEAMLLIVGNDAPLGPEWKNHPLRGGREGFLECHIGGDFLLIYKVDDTIGPSGVVTSSAPEPTATCSMNDRRPHSHRFGKFR